METASYRPFLPQPAVLALQIVKQKSAQLYTKLKQRPEIYVVYILGIYILHLLQTYKNIT